MKVLMAMTTLALLLWALATWASVHSEPASAGPRVLCAQAYVGPLASDAAKAEPTVVTQPDGPVRPLEGSQ